MDKHRHDAACVRPALRQRVDEARRRRIRLAVLLVCQSTVIVLMRLLRCYPTDPGDCYFAHSGNALNHPPVQPSSGCTMSCPGASGEKCGGADAMLVFSVNCSGVPISPPPPPAPSPPAEAFDWMDPCNLTGVTNRTVGFGWCDYSAGPKARAVALVAEMTLDEKARTMQPFAPPIPRLRLPPLWTTDALHGAFSSPHYSNCTVFPQAVANAASFDRA